MNLSVIDTHAHLDMPEFDSDREAVLQRAADAGVSTIITIGIDSPSNLKAVELAQKYPGIFAAVGIHPQESKKVTAEEFTEMASLIKNPRVVAVGEMGLDYYREYSPRETQIRVFQQQLDIAKNAGLPVIIHSRQAQEDMISILKSWCNSFSLPAGKCRGVIHCFGGDAAAAAAYIDMGFCISIGGYIGYPSSAQLREVIPGIPLDRLVVETDCPFLPPQKFRGKRNEPSYTLITLEILAGIKKVSLEEMARYTTQNATKLFNLNQY